jgi:hypothetical protein
MREGVMRSFMGRHPCMLIAYLAARNHTPRASRLSDKDLNYETFSRELREVGGVLGRRRFTTTMNPGTCAACLP